MPLEAMPNTKYIGSVTTGCLRIDCLHRSWDGEDPGDAELTIELPDGKIRRLGIDQGDAERLAELFTNAARAIAAAVEAFEDTKSED